MEVHVILHLLPQNPVVSRTFIQELKDLHQTLNIPESTTKAFGFILPKEENDRVVFLLKIYYTVLAKRPHFTLHISCVT